MSIDTICVTIGGPRGPRFFVSGWNGPDASAPPVRRSGEIVNQPARSLEDRVTETLRGLIVDRFGSVLACERETGISRTQLNRALQGKGISLDTARRLGDVLEVSIDALLILLDRARTAAA